VRAGIGREIGRKIIFGTLSCLRFLEWEPGRLGGLFLFLCFIPAAFSAGMLA
jgi:hypothetical protein